MSDETVRTVDGEDIPAWSTPPRVMSIWPSAPRIPETINDLEVGMVVAVMVLPDRLVDPFLDGVAGLGRRIGDHR